MTMKLIKIYVILIYIISLTFNLCGQQRLVSPGDYLRIDIGADTERRVLFKVDGSGVLDLESLGRINTNGMSFEQLNAAITQSYANINKLDVSTIRVRTRRLEPKIKVTGNVNMPIELPYAESITVINALGAAGGLKSTVQNSSVLIIRSSETIVVNLAKIVKHPEMDLILHPGDEVQVK